MVSAIRPYIYDGNLHSFDITVRDNSNVVITGIAGTEAIPFEALSRWGTGVPGEIRMHVDVDTTSLVRALPVTVTMISTKGQGSPICISNVQFVLPSQKPIPEPQAPALPNPVSYTPTISVIPKNEIPSAPSTGKTPTSKSDSREGEVAQKPPPGVSVTSALTQSLKRACETQRSSQTIWGLLLLGYALFAAYIALIKPGFLARSLEGLAAAIVLPFIALVGFWYFAEHCRGAEWVQLLTPAIALIALVVAFWEEEKAQTLPLLPR